MHKYHFNVKIDQRDNNAGTKAVEDCKTILLSRGYKDLEVAFTKKWYLLPLNLLKLLATVAFYAVTIRPNSLLFIQYPLLGINRFFGFVVSVLQLKGCKFACIIHDLDSLRSPYNSKGIQREMSALSVYDAVIAHNPVMRAWLLQQGCKGLICEIGLFDYLSTANNQASLPSDTVAFAGNLARGSFLQKLAHLQMPLTVNLYGPGFNAAISAINPRMQWHGSFSTEQIVQEMNGGYGLIWDGESTDDIEGLTGNYQKFNTPHKTSLYLVAGLPVITSNKAAIAPIVKQQNIGICVNGIGDIPAALAAISTEQYNTLQQNVFKVAASLQTGGHFRAALHQVETHLFPHQA